MNEETATNVAEELDLIETIRYAGEEASKLFFEYARQLMKALDVRYDDQRLSFTTTANRRFAFTIGQRYCIAYVPEEQFPWHFIQPESLPTTKERSESSYSGAHQAFYERCLKPDDVRTHFDGIVKAARIELERSSKSSFAKHSNQVLANSVADVKMQESLFEKAKVRAGDLNGLIWKLGCNWAAGKPSFYNFIRDEAIVIGVAEKPYRMGDLILITEGFRVKALGLVIGESTEVTSIEDYKNSCESLNIPWENWLVVYKAMWYEIPETMQFEYKLQQGIRKVNSPDIRAKAMALWAHRSTNYWLFQGNADQYDFAASLRNNALNSWVVKAHQDKINAGDKVIIWITGKVGGCVALAEITAAPGEITETDRDYWKSPPMEGLRAGLRITHDFSQNPISREEIAQVEALSSLNAGNQGTNFRANYNEYQALLNLRTKSNPIKAVMHHLTLNTIFYGPPGTGKTYKMQGLMDKHFVDKNAVRNPREVLAEKLQAYPLWKVLAAVLNQFNAPASVAQIHETDLVMAKLNPETKMPRNSIWRTLQSYADAESTSIDAKYKATLQLFTKNENSRWSILPSQIAELEDILDAELLSLAKAPLANKTEQGQIISKRYRFITFHQKYNYEDFIEGITPVLQDADEEEAGGLQFTLKKGIFYDAALQALKLAGYHSFAACYEDGFENRQAKFTAAQADSSKHFALFIDEINRANISAVFGELITLLEDDKRAGAKNEMWVKLPASGEMFSVPLNLYVIGTMNTADRSIALLDIALRRRFQFEGLYPEYVEGTWWKDLLLELNKAIYKTKKNADLFIGHAFFIKKSVTDRSDILNHKIIPLLNEYCQNNQEQVKTILREAKIEFSDPSIENNFQLIAN